MKTLAEEKVPLDVIFVGANGPRFVWPRGRNRRVIKTGAQQEVLTDARSGVKRELALICRFPGLFGFANLQKISPL